LPIADCRFRNPASRFKWSFLPISNRQSAIGNVINQQSSMKFTRYSKFKGFDVSSINLGALMDSMSDTLLDSDYDDIYY